MDKPVNLGPTLPMPLLPTHRKNYVFAMMQAVSNDQTSMSMQQIADSKSTMLAVKFENALYQHWNGILDQDDKNIQGVIVGSTNSGEIIQQLQEQYNVDSAKAQADESQQDGSVQSGQGQTSTDASNLQMKAQMVQSLTGILSTVTNMLGVIVS